MKWIAPKQLILVPLLLGLLAGCGTKSIEESSAAVPANADLSASTDGSGDRFLHQTIPMRMPVPPATQPFESLQSETTWYSAASMKLHKHTHKTAKIIILPTAMKTSRIWSAQAT